MNATLLAALSIGTITYFDCNSERHDDVEEDFRIEWKRPFLLPLSRERMRLSIHSVIVFLQSRKATLSTPDLLDQEFMHSSNPTKISSLARSKEKGNGSRYLGPLATRVRS